MSSWRPPDGRSAHEGAGRDERLKAERSHQEQPQRGCAFLSLSLAILRGFLRDKGSVFFAVLFPLMFLVLFGGTPAWQQIVSRLLPLRWLNEGMLDVMVRSEGSSAILVPMAVLAGFAIVVTGLAARLFSWPSSPSWRVSSLTYWLASSPTSRRNPSPSPSPRSFRRGWIGRP